MAKTSRSYRRLASAVIAVATLAGTAVLTTSVKSTATSTAVSAAWITEQVNFLLSKQLPSGAILGTGTKINPYFANIGALGLVAANTTSSRAGALNWMKWYLAHLNAAALNVPANSVFDYTYDPVAKTETSVGDFDSVDSYASTTLNLAYRAYSSGDAGLQSYVSTNIGTYEAIANLLDYGPPTGVRIQAGNPDADLTDAKPSYLIAYTMDNSEVYSGLRDFALLETLLGRTAQSTYYSSWANTTKNAIISKLWNPTNNNWNWAYANSSNTNIFYAQGVAQLWPIIHGVVTPTDPKATSGWAQFSASYPTWYNSVPDGYPWVSIARAAQLMGETAHADSHLTNVHTRYAPGFTQPTSCGVTPCGNWYDGESGWFILAGLTTWP
jgi:hypothetical protein